MAFSSNWFKELTSSRPPSGAKIVTGIMLAATLFGAFYAGLFPLRGSNDPWWHVKSGQILAEHMYENGFSFPEHDAFTYTGEQTDWVNHEWLSQLIFYWIYSIGGFQLAVVFKSFILMLTIFLLILYMVRNGVTWSMACLGGLITIMAMTGTLFLRPPIFTYLFMVIFLHIVLCFQLGEYFRTAIIGAIVGQVVWINLHGGGIIGIILVFFWWLSEVWFVFVNWLNENPTAPSFKRLQTSTLVLAGVSIASFINPFTYHIHLLPLHVMSDRFLLTSIGELRAPDMQIYNAFEMIILGLFLVPMLRTGSVWVYEALAIVFFGHQALNHLRHIPLFALVATPTLMSVFSEERQALLTPTSNPKVYTGFWGALSGMIKLALKYYVDIVLACLLVVYMFGLRPGKIWHRNTIDLPHLVDTGYDKSKYPVSAVNFIEREGISGPMYNQNNFAGYLIYRLSPGTMKVYTDTRYDLWGSVYAKEELSVWNALTVPFGAYDADGNWLDFRGQGVQDRDSDFLQRALQSGAFPELQEWYDSGKEYWQFVLDKYDANFFICYDNQVIDRVLRKRYYGWHLVFHEKGYVIWMRDSEANQEHISRFRILPEDQYLSAE